MGKMRKCIFVDGTKTIYFFSLLMILMINIKKHKYSINYNMSVIEFMYCQ